MEKELVSYEIALALKELGFNEPCFTYYYDIPGELRKNISVDIHNGWTYFPNLKLITLAPTFSQAFKFFREKYQWQSYIEPTSDQHNRELGYNYCLWNNKTGEEYNTMPQNCPSGDWEFEKYEEAEQACLLKLIEVVKKK